MAICNSLEEVLGCVVGTRDNLGVAFRVGGPLNDDLVKVVLGLEVSARGVSIEATMNS